MVNTVKIWGPLWLHGIVYFNHRFISSLSFSCQYNFVKRDVLFPLPKKHCFLSFGPNFFQKCNQSIYVLSENKKSTFHWHLIKIYFKHPFVIIFRNFVNNLFFRFLLINSFPIGSFPRFKDFSYLDSNWDESKLVTLKPKVRWKWRKKFQGYFLFCW